MNNFDPELYVIAVSNKCNIKCRHCHNDSDAAKTMSISNEEITASLDKIRSSTVKRLVATGGEIFLFPEQLKHVIKEARKRDLAVNLNTNGYWGKSPKVITTTHKR